MKSEKSNLKFTSTLALDTLQIKCVKGFAMNYQVFPIFTRITTLLFFLFSFISCFFGISALLTYCVLVGLFFPISISMRLHRLNETGIALTLTENTQWITYIHGFPAQEQRAVLKNPCFWSTERIQQFFIRCFVGKMVLQGSCIAILAYEFQSFKGSEVSVILALLALLYLLYMSAKSAHMLYLVATNQWQCESLTTSRGSIWYQGFLPTKEGRDTLFARLC